MIISFVFLCIQLGFAIFFSYMCISYFTGAPFVPTKHATALSMIRLANIHPGDIIYDLGSGNGKLLLLASKKGARAIGFEINPVLVLLSLVRGTNTRWKNFWNADIHDANVIFLYLIPWKMERLAEKLKKDLKPGTIIVSNSFIFPHWKIIRRDTVNHVYVFRI